MSSQQSIFRRRAKLFGINPIRRLAVTLGIITGGIILFFVTAALSSRVDPQPLLGTATPGMQDLSGEGLILPELPADATQTDYGWEAYRLVCSACHAYDGTGLTAEWISTWDPSDQNCWQSKCHATNHPPDGFELPHYVPPIVGPGELDAYTTAQDLYTYIKAAMPWQDPGYLTDQEYWNISAYLIKANGFTLPEESIGPENGANVIINPSRQAQATPVAAQSPAQAAPPMISNREIFKIVIVVLAISAVLAGVYAYFTNRRKSL